MNPHFVRRASCPACEGGNVAEILRLSYTSPPISDYLVSFYAPQGGVEFDLLAGNDYALAECRTCGLIYQSEIPGPDLSLTLYEKWIDPHKAFDVYEAPRDLAYFLTLTDEIANIVEQFGVPPARLKVLDFGMGWGFWCRAASGLGCEAHGVDISPSRLENAARRGIPTLRWDEIRDNQFDLINADQVFEHIPEPLETLRRLGRALKPDGFLKVSVPDGRGVKRYLVRPDWKTPAGAPRSLNPVAPLEHINCFTRGALLAMGARAELAPAFVPRRLVIATTPGIVRPLFVRKVVKALAGAQARWFAPKGTTVLFKRRS